MADLKVVLVPDGLNGERVDAAIARMLGLSRSRSTDLIAAGRVRLDGGLVVKSDRVRSGGLLEVELEDRADGPAVVPNLVPGIRIVHDDDDIVVVDKPVGVAAHPSLGWEDPTSSPTWPVRGSGSPPPACRSGRGSCSGWTSAPRG